ncbi:hypothetical protein QBC39DRAFT_347566 [Podospora conica]|nr:hypothetical protein QBC39DRAFT_347566 [Schizothecium conicum]
MVPPAVTDDAVSIKSPSRLSQLPCETLIDDVPPITSHGGSASFSSPPNDGPPCRSFIADVSGTLMRSDIETTYTSSRISYRFPGELPRGRPRTPTARWLHKAFVELKCYTVYARQEYISPPPSRRMVLRQEPSTPRIVCISKVRLLKLKTAHVILDHLARQRTRDAVPTESVNFQKGRADMVHIFSRIVQYILSWSRVNIRGLY